MRVTQKEFWVTLKRLFSKPFLIEPLSTPIKLFHSYLVSPRIWRNTFRHTSRLITRLEGFRSFQSRSLRDNVSSTNYFTLYQRFRRTDITISSKSLSFYVSPLLNPPLRMGGLAYGLVKRILYRGSSLKFTAFFSSNSRYLIRSDMSFSRAAMPPGYVFSMISEGFCSRVLLSRAVITLL